jgi:glycosyltransferase
VKISIITATFNSEKTIYSTLQSVDNQTYKNIEHIIIDGKSTDKTLEIVAKFSSVSKVISEKDSGVYFALNKGIKKASGDVIGFLHADDFFANDLILEKIAEKFKNTNADILYADLDYVAFENHKKIIRHWKSGDFSVKKLKKGWMPPHPTFYVKKSIYDRLGYFDTSFSIAADYDLMLRFLSDKTLKVVYLPEVAVKMRVGGISNRNLKNILQKSREDFRAMKKNHVGNFFSLIMKNLQKIPQFF